MSWPLLVLTFTAAFLTGFLIVWAAYNHVRRFGWRLWFRVGGKWRSIG